MGKCKDCKYYVLFEDGYVSSFADGDCHRFPKTSSNKQESTGCEEELFMHIQVLGDYDWCGEFELKGVVTKVLWSDFSWSVRVHKALGSMGISSAEKLVEHSRAELLRQPNFGMTCLREVIHRLADYNLCLRG